MNSIMSLSSLHTAASDVIDLCSESILVTGANGFIGTKVVEILLEYGCRNVRCFVRPSSRLERLNQVLREEGGKTEIVVGDLRSPADCLRAARGISVIYHLAAGFDKSFADALENSAVATGNLLHAYAACGTPKRFVCVSSFAVYSNFRMQRRAPLDETTAIEESPELRRDAYAFGKIRQEEIVRAIATKHRIPFVILRPGAVFGPGKRELTGRIGVRVSRLFFHIGGSNQLPLTYVENCAEAVVLAGLREGIEGETFNVVDDELLTSSQFLEAYRARADRLICLRVPYVVAYALFAACEICRKYVARLPERFNRRRCAADWKGNRFSNQKLRERLGWRPRVSMKDGMEAFLAQFDRR